MKVPPGARKIKPSSVVLTKLAPSDLPDGITCNIHDSPGVACPLSITMNSTTSEKQLPGEADSGHGLSGITNSYTDDRPTETSSIEPLRKRSKERNAMSPTSYFKQETLGTSASENVYEASPRKRRKLHFPSSPRPGDVNLHVLSDSEITDGNMTRNAKEQPSTSSRNQQRITMTIPTVIGVSFGSSDNNISNIHAQTVNTSTSLESSSGGINVSTKVNVSNNLFAKSEGIAMKNSRGNFGDETRLSCKPKELTTKSHDDTITPFTPGAKATESFILPKNMKKSNNTIENITAKLMREKQEAGNCSVPAGVSLPKTNRQALITSAYTAVKPTNKQLSVDQRGHRSRKRPVQKQYVRSNSAIVVPLKEESLNRERCSSVPSPGASKLKETRKLLKSAISASAVNTKVEYTALEDWMHGMPKNVPNILVKSKSVSKSKDISKIAQSSTCSKSAILEQICDDTASTELGRLEKVKISGNPENFTKIKPKRNRKKQSETPSDNKNLPGPSGYRKISGAILGEGILPKTSPDKTIPISDAGKNTLNKVFKSRSVHMKIPNSFSHVTDFHLPNVEGSPMTINKPSYQKGRNVSGVYKNDTGSSSPVSVNRSSKSTITAAEKEDVVNTTTLPSKSVPGAKSSVQMGSFAISKSQEIIPIKSAESFLTPITKQQKPITPIRPGHAISYADYCAQMDDAEAAKDAASKQRRKSDSGVNTVSEFRKSDAKPQEMTINSLKNDENLLLKKLNQLNFSTKCSDDSTSAHSADTTSQSSDTVDVLISPTVKQEKGNTTIKYELDDDDDKDSVHLSDHRYTKTPDASPAKPLTTGLLQKTSTEAGTVVIGSRNQPPQDNRKHPVYAVKYGDKLFLIHGKDNKKGESTKMDTNTQKQSASNFKAISPKIPIKTEPVLSKKNSHKVNTGKVVSKRKLDFIKKLVLNQKSVKRQKKQGKQTTVYSCRSNRTSVYRNSKVVYIKKQNDTIQTTTSRVNITLTKGTDAKLKRWSRYADFTVQLTYDTDNRLIHITVDELQSGFYKVTPVSEMSDTRTITAILTCLPPHPDIITAGDTFIAVGPLRNVMDTGNGGKHTAVWPSYQLGKHLNSILPFQAMCHGDLHSSDTSYRPKQDASEWYQAAAFDTFTRKYCRQKRVVQRGKWNRGPYEKAFY